MRGAAMTRPESAAGNADIACERRQAGDGASGLPAVGAFVHRTAAEHDHRRSRLRITSCQRDNAFGRDAGDGGGPLRCVVFQVCGEWREADRVFRDESGVVQLLGADHVRQRQRQCRIGARADQ